MEPFTPRQYQDLVPCRVDPKADKKSKTKSSKPSLQSGQEPFYPFYDRFEPGANLNNFTLPRVRNLQSTQHQPLLRQDPARLDNSNLWPDKVTTLLHPTKRGIIMNHQFHSQNDNNRNRSTTPEAAIQAHYGKNPPVPSSWNPQKPKDFESHESQSKRTREDWQNRIIESEKILRPPQLLKSRNANSESSPPISVISTSGTNFTESGSSTGGHYYSLPGSRISEIESTGTLRTDSGIMSGSHQSDQASLTRQSTNSGSIALPPKNTNGLSPSPSVIYADINKPDPPKSYCSSCNGAVPQNQLDTIPEISSLKADTGFWNYHHNFHYPVQRNNSIGGFTLNGQQTRKVKTGLSRFCSSHKIALVVSTFSLLVTIGLVITLILMKNMGMMEPM